MHLDDVPRPWLVALAAVAVAYAIGVLLRGWTRRRRMQRRFVRGAEGEREAVDLLTARGFRIEGAQVSGAYALEVDESAVTVRVCADYVVSRGGQRFVAEVKTGRLAPKVETPATRRQLLEYEHAFGVSGILLVDADAGTVRRVRFGRRRSERRWPVVVLLAGLAGLAALAALRSG